MILLIYSLLVYHSFWALHEVNANDGDQNPPKVHNHGVSLPTTRPLNIAHRGSSGILPEHTIKAYEQAILDGADVIECDVYVTKDLELVCLHDVFLSEVTDIQNHPEFIDRKRKLAVPNEGEVDDWFSFDFTLAELKTLRKVQPFDFRDPRFNGEFQISTLKEHVQVAQTAPRQIGIYPEIKTPAFVNAQPFMNGTRVEDLVLSVLMESGCSEADDPCFIQSFDESSLKYIRPKTNLPLVMLTIVNTQVYGPNLNESKLPEWGSLFYGIGVFKNQIVPFFTFENGSKNPLGTVTSLVTDAMSEGLRVHVYTFRNEDRFLAWDFGQDPLEEYEFFRKLGIDGYFTDFPKTFDRYLDTVYREDSDPDVFTDDASLPTFNKSTIAFLLIVNVYNRLST